MTTLVATSMTMAQDASVSGGPGRPPMNDGIVGQIRNIFNRERQETREEFRDSRGEARGQLKDDMMQRKEWMQNGSSTGMATPTPWKNYKENMKEARGEMKEEIKDIRGNVMMKMASVTDAQITTISSKLGISADVLKAQLASGTPLRQIIGNKISPEEMMLIMPKVMMGSGTMATGTRPSMWNENREDRQERREARREENPRGFFNAIRARLMGTSTDVGVDTNLQAEVNNSGIRNFFKKLFNF